jgi:hypothetical protein
MQSILKSAKGTSGSGFGRHGAGGRKQQAIVFQNILHDRNDRILDFAIGSQQLDIDAIIMGRCPDLPKDIFQVILARDPTKKVPRKHPTTSVADLPTLLNLEMP